MIEKEKEYAEHISESWKFATNTAEKTTKENKDKLSLLIFEKICSPYHYFMEKIGIDTTSPTPKQLEYAKKLGISNLENYSKQTLSDEIDRVKKERDKTNLNKKG